MSTFSPQPSASRRLAARHPVAVFLLVALPASTAVISIPAMAAYDVIPGKHLPERVGLDLEETASLLLVTVLVATALTVTRLVDGHDGVRILLRRTTRWRVPLRWWLLAVTAMPAGTVGLAVILGDHAHLPSVGTLAGETVALLVAFALANLGEEVTWTGFLQTRLERRHSFFLVAFLTAIPFAVVHLQLRVVTGEVSTAGELAGSSVVLVVFCMVFRTFIGTVARGAANSVLLAAVTHTFFNRSNNVDGIAADILSGPHRQSAATMTALVVTATLAALNRRRLTRAYRHQLDAAENTAIAAAPAVSVPLTSRSPR